MPYPKNRGSGPAERTSRTDWMAAKRAAGRKTPDPPLPVISAFDCWCGRPAGHSWPGMKVNEHGAVVVDRDDPVNGGAPHPPKDAVY